MKYWILLAVFVTGAVSAAGSGGINAPDQRGKPYLVLVSIDGFRWDYQDLFDTPTLDRIAAGGLRADRLIPVFPTLTFPNHYSIATGLYPANHGLIGNRFPGKDRNRFYNLRDPAAVQDGSWYGGQPVWVAAEKAGMVTAAYYFVGTEADIDGVPMTYWHPFDASVAGLDRVQQVIDWLSMPAEKRPHLVTLYFENVDTATHRAGPGSAQSITSISEVDDYLAALLNGIDALPIGDEIYVIVVSDHGQLPIKPDEPAFLIEDVADLEGLVVVDHGAAAFIYFSQDDDGRAVQIRDAINASWQHGKAILRQDAPTAWRLTGAAGFAPLIVQADPGYLVFSNKSRATGNSLGNHGWAPETEGMQGIFLAMGPRLPSGRRIPAIDAVDVYPLMMGILGLPITTPIDGDPHKLTRLLQP